MDELLAPSLLLEPLWEAGRLDPLPLLLLEPLLDLVLAISGLGPALYSLA